MTANSSKPHGIWFKAATTTLICIFYAHINASSLPAKQNIPVTNAMLQPPGMFSLILNNIEEANKKRASYEQIILIDMALKSCRFTDINASLDECYDGQSRILNLHRDPEKTNGKTIVEVEIIQGIGKGKKYRIVLACRDLEHLFNEPQTMDVIEMSPDGIGDPSDGMIVRGDMRDLARRLRRQKFDTTETFEKEAAQLKKLVESSGLRGENRKDVIKAVDDFKTFEKVVFNAIVLDARINGGKKNHWLLGFNSQAPPVMKHMADLFPRPTLGYASEVLSRLKDEARLEYLLHEPLCNIVGHHNARKILEELFKDTNYKGVGGRAGKKDGAVTRMLQEAIKEKMESPAGPLKRPHFLADNVLMELRSMDGKLLKTYDSLIEPGEMAELDNVVIRRKLLAKGILRIEDREKEIADFDNKYAGRVVDVHIEKGFAVKTIIYKKDPDKGIEEEIVFRQLIDKDTGKLVHTWHKNFHSQELKELLDKYPEMTRMLLKSKISNSNGALRFAGQDNIAKFGSETDKKSGKKADSKYYNRQFEADVIRGHGTAFITEVRFYKKGSTEEFEEPKEFSRLMASNGEEEEEPEIVCTWYNELRKEKLRKLSAKYPKMLLKSRITDAGGALNFGGHGTIRTFGKEYYNRQFEADVIRGYDTGFITEVRFYKEGADKEFEEPRTFSQLLTKGVKKGDAPQIICTWEGRLTAKKFRKAAEGHTAMLLKDRIDNGEGLLSFAGMFAIANFGEEYSQRWFEADVVKGIERKIEKGIVKEYEAGFITKVRFYKKDSAEELEQSKIFSILSTETEQGRKIVWTWYKQFSDDRLKALCAQYPRMILKDRIENKKGSLNFAGQHHIAAFGKEYYRKWFEGDVLAGHEKGFITKVRFYKKGLRGTLKEPKIFSQLLARTDKKKDGLKIVHTWYKNMYPERLKELSEKYPRMLLKSFIASNGKVSFGGKRYHMHKILAGMEVEAEVINGEAEFIYLKYEETETEEQPAVDLLAGRYRVLGEIACVGENGKYSITFEAEDERMWGRKVSIKLAAKRAKGNTFRKGNKIRGIYNITSDILRKIPKTQRFILQPNEYGISRIVTDNILAVKAPPERKIKRPNYKQIMKAKRRAQKQEKRGDDEWNWSVTKKKHALKKRRYKNRPSNFTEAYGGTAGTYKRVVAALVEDREKRIEDREKRKTIKKAGHIDRKNQELFDELVSYLMNPIGIEPVKQKEIPVDILIDLALIPKKDLESNIDTWARLILLCKDMKNVNFVFEETPELTKKGILPEILLNEMKNAPKMSTAMNMLRKKIKDYGKSYKDVDNLVNNRVGNTKRRGNGFTVEIPIISKELAEWAIGEGIKLKENQYPVVMDGLTSYSNTNVPLRDFKSALMIGLAKANFAVAVRRIQLRERGAEEKLKILKEKLLVELNELYELIRKDDSPVYISEKILEYMMHRKSTHRLSRAIDYYVPLITRKDIEAINEIRKGIRNTCSSA